MAKPSYYKTQIIRKQTIARLVPPDANYGDCICKLTLTDHYFYVLEDNFDGTYQEHFNIPLSWIHKVEIVSNREKSKMGRVKSSRAVLLVAIIMNVIVGNYAPSNEALGGKAEIEYLKITYTDVYGEKNELFFKDVKQHIKGFVRRFQKKI